MRIRLGIAGCGRITTTCHLSALRRIREIQIAGFADSDAQRLQSVAAPYPLAKRYGGFEELIEDASLDAVAICLPPAQHYAAAAQALRAKKHLFLEKPVALNLQESAGLVDLAETTETVALVGFNLRWHRLIREARRILRLGVLGKIRAVNSTFSNPSMLDPQIPEWRKSPGEGGGALHDQAIHHFDLWRFLLEAEVRTVTGLNANTEQTAVVCAETDSGVLLSATMTQASAPNNEFDIYGDRGRLHLSLYQTDGIQFYSLRSLPGDFGDRFSRFQNTIRAIPALFTNPAGNSAGSYVNEWKHFVHCIQSNSATECSLLDGHRALEILTTVMESSPLLQRVQREFN